MSAFPYKVELLSPAGSREALVGAISAGADAVYLGGERFGARAYADNFSTEEILRALREAHVLGRKIYLTANVLTREEEMPELVSFVQELHAGGLDGAIVQDLGVLAALHEACPDLALHASTQMSVTSAESVQYLRRFGVRRVVPARELSLEEIRALRKEDMESLRRLPEEKREGMRPIEIEAFIHGAMCYSYSGRCLMSSFLGGRSGNRGRCAGTCRLPHRILDGDGRPAGPDARKKEVYPLSMKDMCVLSILPELIDAGIHSFKIEGRMKKPVYAAGVTAIYRKYIDRCYAWMEEGRPGTWKVEEEDLKKLRALYIRTDLGTGYYHTRNGRNLITIGKPGYAGTDPALEEEIRRKYTAGLPRREITGRAVFRIGEPARLTVSPVCAAWKNAGPAQKNAGSAGKKAGAFPCPEKSVSVTAAGPVVQPASGRPLSGEELEARLRRSGESLFTFADLTVEADDNVFLPVSAVNALRREALDLLEEKLARAAGLPEAASERAAEAEEPARTARTVPGEAAQAEESAEHAQQVSGEAEEPARTAQQASGEAAEAAEIPRTAQQFSRGRGTGPELWALVSTRAQLEAAVQCGCAGIIIDGEFTIEKTQNRNISDLQSAQVRIYCALPPVFRVYEREKIREMIRTASEKGFDGILVRTLEELETALQTGYSGELIADAALYSWNTRAMAALTADCSRVICALELSRAGIRRAAGGVLSRLILPVYGRVPMMETAGCVRKTELQCSGAKRQDAAAEDGFWYLEDRMGKRLPVRCRCAFCANTIYNAVPVSLHQYAGRGLYREASVHLCMFTTESRQQTQAVLRYFGGLSDEGGSGKSARERRKPPFSEYTNGHYKTGAL
ncbi:MAG: U32 family peptidase [Eubacteriales bacterium]|nr:U32 family peptidase [Eubacteriales bacterium]